MASPRKENPSVPAQVADLDSFEVIEIHRSQLKGAPYNPRVLADREKIKLRRGIERHGFVAPPVWNARTGNIVGGHQRLTIRDAITGSKDYRLKVAKIDVDETREKEINLLLNNPEAMGDWDVEKLGAMLRDPEINLDGTGFDTGDVYHLFGDAVFEESASEETLKKLAESLDASNDSFQKQRAKEKAEDHHFYLVVVFKGSAERTAFTAALGLEDNRYQDGRMLLDLLKERAGDPPSGDERAPANPGTG